ncbi:MAG: peptidoglycan DD-metalloendopeptidase family protein [Bacilli bacterium]|nr:peptidoglycan DD-metalloendopeptidase family protein [Bacilli bacterium]
MMKKKDLFILKLLISIIIFLILGILCKVDDKYKNKINYYLFENSFNFNSVYNFYNKYLGGTSFYEKRNTLHPVFYEELKYNKIEKYKQGIKLEVTKNYLIPAIKKGTVINIKNHKYYNNTIIINTDNNINIWYGNICNPFVKIYDHLDKGKYIGQSCQNYIYIIYEKNGKYLDYKKYFFPKYN